MDGIHGTPYIAAPLGSVMGSGIFFAHQVAEVPEEVHGRRSSKDRHGFVDAEGLACAGHADNLHLGAKKKDRGAEEVASPAMPRKVMVNDG